MRKIKFRGRDTYGNLHYGDFVQGMYIANEQGVHMIKPESVRQFVGYDKNNEEVYEGDGVNLPVYGWGEAELRSMVIIKVVS